MTALDNYFLSSEDKKVVTSFVSILQRCGNKQRALSTIFSLFAKLKHGLAGYPIAERYPLSTLDEKNPIQLIHKCLYNIKPAFLIRRIIKSGKRYDLPVPISENRANFMAIHWLRKTVLKNNKNDLSLAFLLAQEISASLYHEGSTTDFLRAYIDIALDQRPFSRFIKRKTHTVSKSKRTGVALRLEKIHQHIRQILKARKYHTIAGTRRINMHNLRYNIKNPNKMKKNFRHKRRRFKTK